MATKSKKYEIEVGGPFTKTVLRQRIATLKAGIEANAYKGDALRLAKRRLYHYQYHLEILRQETNRRRRA